MQIAYISLHWPREKNSGIGKKMERQISSWRSLGHDVQFFSHMHTIGNQHSLVEGRRFLYTAKNDLPGLVSTEISRTQDMKQLIAAVKSWQPNIIYLRWGMYVHPLKQLFSIAPAAIEINTNDVEEHKLLGIVKSTYNLLTRSITLNGASGIVYSTRELADCSSFTSFNKPGIIISNSIDLDAVPMMPAPKNKQPHLVFIGTPGFAWHGVEKLVELAKRFPGMVIDLIGYDHLENISNPPKNLILHGYLSGDAYEQVIGQADSAIGTLALHRKGMDEASPLKIRDCTARGIPCILPYVDTDLDDLESKLILRIPNRENNTQTHGKEIYDFVCGSQGKRISRKSIQGRIDSRIKEAARLEFMESLLQGQQEKG